MPSSPFAARPLDPADLPQAMALAAGAGAHGVYVRNLLSGEDRGGDDGELLGFYGKAGLLGLASFGSRGNLVLVEAELLDPGAVAEALRKSAWTWRIVLARRAVVDALAACESVPPLLLRNQIYYAMRPEEARRELVRDDVRRATPRDLRALVQAALELNRVDLNVDPTRVHRGWLEESLRRRIRRGRIWTIGPPGRPVAKLDVGSQGTAGMVLEGVFTVPEARGRGLAASLVATVAHRRALSRCRLVCLHVGAGNTPARKAYERAGMRVAGECGIMLRG